MSKLMSFNERKHECKNPFVRQRIRQFHATIVEMVRMAGPKSLIEVGCGEGYVLEAISRVGIDVQMDGFDICSSTIDRAQRRLGNSARVRCSDIHELISQGVRGDVVLAIEVLEHLRSPEEMLECISRLTRQFVILSVPMEPWFQVLNLIRGRYVSRWGNHPEHLQRWTRRTFLSLVRRYFRIIESPVVFPWTLVLAELPGDRPLQNVVSQRTIHAS
jgi:2-polyprenyl-3-methyl-5-hydroxy-6-metoxy-1,4-benzoquinol methylase